MAHPDPTVKEIGRDDLIHRMHEGERFIIVDVLSHDHFERAHLPGAINVPVLMLRELAPILFTDQDEIVVYCANFQCTASTTAAKILMQMGLTDVLDYKGGILDWLDGNLPIIRGEEHHHEFRESA